LPPELFSAVARVACRAVDPAVAENAQELANSKTEDLRQALVEAAWRQRHVNTRTKFAKILDLLRQTRHAKAGLWKLRAHGRSGRVC
jgi:hypothetical protein